MYFILIEENIRVLVSKSLELDLKAYIIPWADPEDKPLENHKGYRFP